MPGELGKGGGHRTPALDQLSKPPKVVLPGDGTRPVLFPLGPAAWELPAPGERLHGPDLREGQPLC